MPKPIERMPPPPPLRLELPDVRAAAIRRHWIGVAQHGFLHGYHSTFTTMPGWYCARWADDASGMQGLTLFPAHDGALCAQAEFMVKAMDAKDGEAGAELSVTVDTAVTARLQKGGWRQVGGMLSVHTLPLLVGPHLKPIPSNCTVQVVSNATTLADFAVVQERAYRESYGTPEGSTAKFYASPYSLIGPDVHAQVLYLDGKPVRATALVRSHGLVSLANDAAIPEVRGLHLSECSIRLALAAAWQLFGVDEVVYVTVPEARSIAARIGLPVVDRYRRMVPTRVEAVG